MLDRNINRRKFLKGLIATGGAAAVNAIPGRVLATSGYEKSPLTPEDTRFFNSIVEDPIALRRFREAPTWRQALAMLRVLARSDTSAVEKKKEELREGALSLFNAKGRLVGRATCLKIPSISRTGGSSHFRYFIVTNKHVVDLGAVAPGKHAWQKDPRGYDIAFAEISEKDATPKGAAKPDAQAFDITASADVSGEVGIVQAERADIYLQKSYPSRISPVLSPQIYDTGFGGLELTTTKGHETRVIVLGPGESTRDENGFSNASAVSGAAWRRANGGFGGLFTETTELTYGQERYSVALVIDAEFVREALFEYMQSQPAIVQARM